MKRESTMSNWEIVCMGDWFRLCGNVVNDARFPDGDKVYTSMLLRVDFEKGIAETKNTIYRLV